MHEIRKCSIVEFTPYMSVNKMAPLLHHFTYLLDSITKSKLKFIIAIFAHMYTYSTSYVVDCTVERCTEVWQKGGLGFFHFSNPASDIES